MKKIIILIFIISLGIDGCSFLVKLNVLEHNNSEGWSKHYPGRQIDLYFSAPYTYYWSEYRDEQTSILLSTRPKYSRRLLFGPAYFIPFFPNIIGGWQEKNVVRFSDKFCLDIILIDKKNNPEVNLGRITYRINGTKVVPSKIMVEQSSFSNLKNPIYNSFLNYDTGLKSKILNYNWNLENFVEIKDTSIKSNNNMMLLRIEFPEINYSVDEFSIDFADFITNKKSGTIPKLEFTDRNIYYYIPFEFGH